MKYQVTKQDLMALAEKKKKDMNNKSIKQLIRDEFKYPGMGGLAQFILDCVVRRVAVRGNQKLGLSEEEYGKAQKAGDLNAKVEKKLGDLLGEQVAAQLIQAWGQNALGVLPNILFCSIREPSDPDVPQIIFLGQPRPEDVSIDVIVENDQVYLEVFCEQIPVINSDTDVNRDSTTFIPGPVKSRFVLVPPKGSQPAYFEFEKFETENEDLFQMLNDMMFSEKEIKDNYCNPRIQKALAENKRLLASLAQLEVDKENYRKRYENFVAIMSKPNPELQTKAKMQTEDKNLTLKDTIDEAVKALEAYQTELTTSVSKSEKIKDSLLHDYKARKGRIKLKSCEVLLNILKDKEKSNVERALLFKEAYIGNDYKHAKILNMNRTHPALRWIKQIISFVPEAFLGLRFLGIGEKGKKATVAANNVIRDFNTVERRGGVSR